MEQTTTAPFAPRPGILERFAPRAMPCAGAALVAVLLNFFQTGGHDQQRTIEVFFLCTLAVLLAVSGRVRGLALLPSRAARGLLLAFFALGSVSALGSLVPRYAFFEVCSLLLLLALGLAIGAEIARDGAANLLRLLQVIGLVCLLYAFKIVVIYLSALSLGAQPFALDFSPGFDNYRFLNHAQTVTLPLLVLLFQLTPPTSRARWLWFALAAFWWTIVWATGARGTFLGMAVGCAGVAAIRHRQAAGFLKAMAATAIAGALAYLLLFEVVPKLAGLGSFGLLSSVVDRSVADPASGRERLWARAAELIAAHPMLGAGPLHFAHYAADVRTGAHPHNWAFQILAEWGIPAFLCLCSAIALGARALVRVAAGLKRDDLRNQHIAAALLATGAAILADGLVSGLLVMPQSQLLIAVYIGCAMGWARSLAPHQPGGRRAAHAATAVAVMLLLASAAGVAAAVWPELGERLGREPLTGAAAAVNHGTQWPRLWLDGYF